MRSTSPCSSERTTLLECLGFSLSCSPCSTADRSSRVQGRSVTFVIVTDDLAVAPPLFSLSLGAHIVVADDETDIRRLIVLILTRRGHTVREAARGDDALALIRGERPDLCVLDVMMPGLSGLEVARELAADRNTAGIPLILLSAKGQAAEVEAGLSTGARAYLVKPFSPIELARLVGEVLSASASEPQ